MRAADITEATVTEPEILDILRAEKPYLREHFGLFGSYAKGTKGPGSDVDVLVELTEPRFDFLASIQVHLKKRSESLSS